MNNTYVVQKGDTLYGISRQFNTSVQKLRELNNLSDDNIVPLQVLIISGGDENNPSECVIYTVVKRDNLYSIAKKYDTTVDAIKRYNNLTSNNLSIGQRIRIPCYMNKSDNTSMPDYVNYTVQAGDNLYSIANKFGTTVDKIKKDNNLKTDVLSIGQILIVKDNKSVSSVEECYGEDFVVPEDYITYTVKSGDNLYSIARKYNTSVSEIKSLNNLSTNNLSIGQVLKIPSTGDTYYIVQAGDSLYSIARKFDTTVDVIKKKNNLTSNLLSLGQKLII